MKIVDDLLSTLVSKKKKARVAMQFGSNTYNTVESQRFGVLALKIVRYGD